MAKIPKRTFLALLYALCHAGFFCDGSQGFCHQLGFGVIDVIAGRPDAVVLPLGGETAGEGITVLAVGFRVAPLVAQPFKVGGVEVDVVLVQGEVAGT